jgi:hypothetical protein
MRTAPVGELSFAASHAARAVSPLTRPPDLVGQLDDVTVGVGHREGRVALVVPPPGLRDAVVREALPQGVDGCPVALQATSQTRPNRDLAQALHISPSTALERTRPLRERGIIRRSTLDVDLAAVGRPVQALIAVLAFRSCEPVW